MRDTPIPLIQATHPVELRYFPAANCGWPSPAADFEEAPLSLDSLTGVSACSTFLVRAKGDSMVGAGIYDGDVLVVQRGAEASIGDIIVAVVDGEFTVKRLGRDRDGRPLLIPENSTMKPIPIEDGSDFQVWGLVRWSLKQH